MIDDDGAPSIDASPTEAEQTPADAVQSAGQIIRLAREASGLHIAALAVALKVPVKKLEALEADQLEELPGATFTRALAASVCRHLKIDAKPVLALLPNQGGNKLQVIGEGINTPFHKPGDLVTLSATWQKLRITVISVLVLLLGSVFLYSLPQAWLVKETTQVQTTVAPAVPTPQIIETAASITMTHATTVTDAFTTSTVPSVVPDTSKTSAVFSQHVSAPVTALASQAAFPEVITVEAKADTWIEVLDKDSQLLVRRILKAGEKQGIQGKPPLMVAIGNAEKTRVAVRGKEFDLASVTRENIARFTVN